MIVPDLRGFGDSDLAPDGFYDLAAHARDLHALVHDVLGHERCAAAGGDLGGVVIQDLGLRFAGFVDAPVPLQHRAAAAAGRRTSAAGMPPRCPRETRMAADYFLPPGARRRRAGRRARHAGQAPPLHRAVLRPALLGVAGRVHAADVDFMTEPFADARQAARRLRRLRDRRSARGRCPSRRASSRRNPVPTLVLYGPDDHVIWPRLPGALRGRVHRPHRARSSCPAPATSSSGSGPTCSTRR